MGGDSVLASEVIDTTNNGTTEKVDDKENEDETAEDANSTSNAPVPIVKKVCYCHSND